MHLYFEFLFLCVFQVEDYAQRKEEDVRSVEKWLGPVLSYDVE